MQKTTNFLEKMVKNHPNQHVRKKAAYVLSLCNEDQPIKLLVNIAVSDEDEEIRTYVRESVIKIGKEKGAIEIKKYLDHPNKEIVKRAKQLLNEF